jgi:predicted ATPase
VSRVRASSLRAPFLKRIAWRAGRPRACGHPFDLPYLTDDFELTFERPITLLVGENGTGKSTLIEAVAAHLGWPSRGGTRDHVVQDAPERSPLAESLRFSWLPRVVAGVYFRAESFVRLADYLDDLAKEHAQVRESWGPRDLHGQSHGESFAQVFEHRLGAGSRQVYLMDEPEAALSPNRQLGLLRLLGEWHRSGNVQAIIATHSPILIHCPEADLISLDRGRLARVTPDETAAVRVMRAFLADPAAAIAQGDPDAD